MRACVRVCVCVCVPTYHEAVAPCRHTSNAQDEATDVESEEVGGEGDTEPPTSQSQACHVEGYLPAEPETANQTVKPLLNWANICSRT